MLVDEDDDGICDDVDENVSAPLTLAAFAMVLEQFSSVGCYMIPSGDQMLWK